MSAQTDISYGRKCGLKVLRELVTSGERAGGPAAALVGSGVNPGPVCPVRVVCLDFVDIADE